MRSGGFQGTERYLLPEGVGSIVSGRVAAVIYGRTDLGKVRLAVRGIDPEVDAVLMALHVAALRWRGSATGTERAPTAELAPVSEWLSTTEAGELLGITSRGVRKAIGEGRLEATEVAGRWRVSREAVEHYRAARGAA